MKTNKVEISKKEINDLFKVDGLFSDERKQQILQAMNDGYKNEKCLKCGLKFMADVHFVRCENDKCPMKTKEESTLLDEIFGIC